MADDDHKKSALIDLDEHERQVYSQNGEDGVLLHLLATLPEIPRVAVEIGVWLGPGAEVGGNECNTRVLCDDDRWTVHQFDAAATPGHPRVANEWVTAENVEEILARYDVPRDIGVFSLDVDGVDYWIWTALTAYRPAIVIVEFNVAFGTLEHCVTIPYDESYRWKFEECTGASLGALLGLARTRGYRLVHCTGPNAFFVAEEHLEGYALDPPDEILERTLFPQRKSPNPQWTLIDVSDPAAPVPWQPPT